MGRNYAVFLLFVMISMGVNFNMPKKIIDQIQMVTVAGHDLAENGKVTTTVVTPFFPAESQQKDLRYTGTANSIYKNKLKLNEQASEQLLDAKMMMSMYNKDLAKKGLSNYVRYLLRDPSIGNALYLAVVEDSSEDFLNTVKFSKGVGKYMEDLMRHNVKHGPLPMSNLKTFSSGLISKGQDPFLPVFGLKKGHPRVKALAFFDEDKLVATIPIEKASVFKKLYESVEDGQYNIAASDFKASIQNMDSSRHINVVQKNGQIEVTINVQMDGVIREFSKDRASRYLTEIEKKVQKDFRKNAKRLIDRFQELGVDPLGIGERAKEQIRDVQQKKFKDVYPDIPITVKTDMVLTEYGVRN
ncbi:Ger(x)C family spore germination protein [Lentibacillus halophilus]|uniref:Ger(X)C family spore germination protein n=1 Tax=Lentibacillus halophilus TaxID=295065 RepID=A0ABN0ZAB2_9BACI